MRTTCETKHTLPLDELTEFQGGLKERTKDDVAKIRRSIERYGFATPFFVWRHGGTNHVLDGHGRLATLKQMRQDGEEIPPLPVVYVDCKDEADAKNLLLRINSTYGKMTSQSVIDFMGGVELDIKEIALPCGTLNLNIDNLELPQNLDDIPKEQNFSVKITFNDYDRLGDFLSLYKDELKEKYDCVISVSAFDGDGA